MYIIVYIVLKFVKGVIVEIRNIKKRLDTLEIYYKNMISELSEAKRDAKKANKKKTGIETLKKRTTSTESKLVTVTKSLDDRLLYLEDRISEPVIVDETVIRDAVDKKLSLELSFIDDKLIKEIGGAIRCEVMDYMNSVVADEIARTREVLEHKYNMSIQELKDEKDNTD